MNNASGSLRISVERELAALRAGFDTSKPNIARVYDFWLGGKDHFAADRAEAERMLKVYPLLPQLARENRLFLARAVEWLARQGIRQFLDIGSGLPTGQNTHQVAQSVDPDCRVAYVDNDPVVMLHATALLGGDGPTIAVRGDLARPGTILADPTVKRLIRLDEPVAVIVAMVLHFFDADNACDITGVFAEAIAPGSYLVISCGSGDEETGGRLTREYTAGTLYNHAPRQIAGFFGGLELADPPGLTDAKHWVPDQLAPAPSRDGGHVLAGVGRKPGPDG